MKQISTEISELLNNDVLGKRKDFLARAEQLAIQDTLVSDITLRDFILQLNEGLDIILECIKIGIIDELPPQVRNTLKNHISDLNKFSSTLFTDTADVNNFINTGQIILDYIDLYSMEIYLKHVPSYKQKITELRDLTNKYQTIVKDFEGAKEVITEADTFLKKLLEKYNQNVGVQSEVSKIRETIANILNEVGAKKGDVEKLVTEINTFSQTVFIPIRDTIATTHAAVTASSNDVQQKQTAIITLLGEATALIEKLKLSNTEYESSLTNLKKIEGSLTELFTKVNDPANGVESKFNSITETKAKVDDLYAKINQSFKVSSDLETKITNIFKDAETKIKFISETKQKAEATFKEIEKIYGITADTAMGGEFFKRSKDFKEDFEGWRSKILYTTIALFFAIILLFLMPMLCNAKEFCDVDLKPSFLLRLTITSPLVFYLVFCTGQYNKAKDSHYKYLFKSTLAFSIKNHINLLSETEAFKDPAYVPQVLDFAIRGLDKIYEEPYYDQSMKAKFKIKMEEIKYGVKPNPPNPPTEETTEELPK